MTAPDMASNKPGLESIQEAKSGAKADGARDKATKWVKEVDLEGLTRGRAGDRATVVGPRFPSRRWGWRQACSESQRAPSRGAAELEASTRTRLL